MKQRSTGMKSFLAGFAAALRPAVLSLCVLSLAACSDSVTDLYVAEGNTTSGSVGPFVETSNLLLTVTSFYAYPGVDGIIIDLDRADTREPMRIGAGDALTVSLNGTPYPLEEIRGYTCDNYYAFSNCRYIYHYRVFFSSADPSGQNLALDFQRTIGTDSVTTVVFPSRPIITQPVAGDIIDLSADDLTVSWQADSAEDELMLELNGLCGVYDTLSIVDKTTTHTFSPGTFSFSQEWQSCIDATELSLPIHTFRTRTYPADAAFSPLSSITLSLNDEITVTAVP